MRTGIPTTPNRYGSVRSIVDEVFDDPKVEARRIFSSFGPLWFAAPFALPTLRYARAGLALFGCCLLGFLFARDWGRVILLSAPVMYVAGAHVLDDRRRLAIAAVPASWRSTWATPSTCRCTAWSRTSSTGRCRATRSARTSPAAPASGSGPSP